MAKPDYGGQNLPNTSLFKKTWPRFSGQNCWKQSSIKILRVPASTPKEWVVDCKKVGNGDKAIIYLGKYLYKGVIQEKDILRCENGKVTFRYIHAKSNAYRTRTVTGEYFLCLLMQHIPHTPFADIQKEKAALVLAVAASPRGLTTIKLMRLRCP
jgi:hypothetical protein